MSEPSFRRILFSGLPGFLREGFLPLAGFYAGWRLSGLGVGIAASATISVLVYIHERRGGRDGLLVRLSLAFVVVQTAVGLLSHSTTVYLATPVVANAVWAFAFLGSAALRRPLAGALACAWYPFPPEFRATREFKQVYGSSPSAGASTCSPVAGCGFRFFSTAAWAASSSSRSSQGRRRCSRSSHGQSGTRSADSRTTTTTTTPTTKDERPAWRSTL